MEKTNDVMNAFKALLTPLIKEVVLTTIEEHQQSQQTVKFGNAELTPDEAAKQLHISKVTLWRWDNCGYLKPVRIGRKTYYRQSDLDAIKQGRLVQ